MIVVRPAPAHAADTLRLPHHARALRRRRVTTASGRSVLLDLAETAQLEEGDGIVLDDGTALRVEAEPEALLEARAASPEGLARLAWHLGNRHAPCEVGEGFLRVPAERPVAVMLAALGAEVREVTAPFRPERGAFAHAHEGASGGL